MSPCTLWYRANPSRGNALEFNHLSDGHEKTPTPAPKRGQQWKGRWSATHAWLTSDKPAKVVFYGPDE